VHFYFICLVLISTFSIMKLYSYSYYEIINFGDIIFHFHLLSLSFLHFSVFPLSLPFPSFPSPPSPPLPPTPSLPFLSFLFLFLFLFPLLMFCFVCSRNCDGRILRWPLKFSASCYTNLLQIFNKTLIQCCYSKILKL
jgi:hypothetical protein